MRRLTFFLAVAALLAFGRTGMEAQQPAPDPEPRFERAISSDDAVTRDERTVFPPETPRIFILYRIAGALPGTRLRAVWYAEKIEGFTPNARLADLSSQTKGAGRFLGRFSCDRPGKSWWPGTYRVELSINDRPATTVRFRVEAGNP